MEEGGDGERRKQANLTLSLLERSSLNGFFYADGILCCVWGLDEMMMIMMMVLV